MFAFVEELAARFLQSCAPEEYKFVGLDFKDFSGLRATNITFLMRLKMAAEHSPDCRRSEDLTLAADTQDDDGSHNHDNV